MEVKQFQATFHSICQVAGVNVQLWLSRTLPQLLIFPLHSLCLIMFPHSMEPQLIIAACLYVAVNRNQWRRLLHCFCHLKQKEKSLVGCRLLLKPQNNRFHCDSSTGAEFHVVNWSLMNQDMQIFIREAASSRCLGFYFSCLQTRSWLYYHLQSRCPVSSFLLCGQTHGWATVY